MERSATRTRARVELDAGSSAPQLRLRALSAIAHDASVETARALVRVAGEAWWHAACKRLSAGRLPPPALPPGQSIATLSRSIISDAGAFGRDLAKLPVAEASAALGQLYTQALPREHRTQLGIFYTPPMLVSHLLDRAEAGGHDWSTGRSIDPSCGGAAFLLPAAERMLAAMQGVEPALALAAIGARLRGWDVDPFAVWLSNLSVEVLALPLVASSGRRLAPVAAVRDALADFRDVAGEYDLVMGNPPFGKVKDRLEIRERFRRSLHGHPNLYGLFTDLAVHLAKAEGGVIAYLTPASFLAGAYFRALRGLLLRLARPVTIDLVESRKDVFGDVLQEVALSVFRRGRNDARAVCSVIVAGEATLCARSVGHFILPKNPEAPWALPREEGDAQLIESFARMPSRLADWGYGVSTGPLVWNRHKDALHDTPAKGRVPVVWAESVTQDGRFILRATKSNHAPWFRPRGPDDPNLVTRPCVLVQRTTAKEQHRRLISAEMPVSLIEAHGAVAVENHLNMVVPIVACPKVPIGAVAAFLATKTADRILRCINASVAVSASELEAMPLPSHQALMAALAEGDREAAIARLYGLQP